MADSIGDQKDTKVADQKPVEQQEEFVPKKAYEETKSDMIKYKAKAKELEARANQLQADADARDKEVLAKNEQWKSLYEKTQSELEKLNSLRSKEKAEFINSHKKNAILKEIGGFKKDDYASFINVDAVEMDESGSINKESLASEVNRIKQAYPELLNSAPAPNLPNGAAKGFSGEKSYASMSEAEKDKYRMKLVLEAQQKKK